MSQQLLNYEETQPIAFNLMRKLLTEFQVTPNPSQINYIISSIESNQLTFRELIGEIKHQQDESRKKDTPQSALNSASSVTENQSKQTKIDNAFFPKKSTDAIHVKKQEDQPQTSDSDASESNEENENDGTSVLVNMTNENLKAYSEDYGKASAEYFKAKIPAYLQEQNININDLFAPHTFNAIMQDYDKIVMIIDEQIKSTILHRGKMLSVACAALETVMLNMGYTRNNISKTYATIFGTGTNRFYVMHKKLLKKYPNLEKAGNDKDASEE